MDENRKTVFELCAGLLSPQMAGRAAGVAYAELRIHPQRDRDDCAVRVQFKDGSVMWLVAEED